MKNKSNLQVMPTPKGNSPVQVPIHEELKNGNRQVTNELTLQNMARKEGQMEERKGEWSREQEGKVPLVRVVLTCG